MGNVIPLQIIVVLSAFLTILSFCTFTSQSQDEWLFSISYWSARDAVVYWRILCLYCVLSYKAVFHAESALGKIGQEERALTQWISLSRFQIPGVIISPQSCVVCYYILIIWPRTDAPSSMLELQKLKWSSFLGGWWWAGKWRVYDYFYVIANEYLWRQSIWSDNRGSLERIKVILCQFSLCPI